MITGTDNQFKIQSEGSPNKTEDVLLDPDKSSSKMLLKFSGTWKGNDLEECLKEVYEIRGETKF